MPLRDEQIDRYSRQIILPEVGGRGQTALLAAAAAVAGTGATAALVARYLVGAGVGRVAVPAAPWAAALAALNPDVAVVAGGPVAPVDVAVAAGAGASALAEVRARSVPVVLAGGAAGRVAHLEASPCAACVAAALGGEPPAPALAGLVAAWLATEALKACLPGQSVVRGAWRIDEATLALVAEPLPRRARCDCADPAIAGAA